MYLCKLPPSFFRGFDNSKLPLKSLCYEGTGTAKVCAKTTARRVSNVSDKAGVDAENNCIGNT